MYTRNQVRSVKIGSITIGGTDQVIIQSMTNTKTKDVSSTVEQILQLEAVGCQLVRVAVLDMEDAKAITKIQKQIELTKEETREFDKRIEEVKNG